MTQTMYAHVNKKIIKKKKERVIQMGKSDWSTLYALYKYHNGTPLND
jgi:hypothetical protein